MKKYDKKIWNEMITGPSYFDDDDETEFETAKALVEDEGWIVCMEGRKVYWKYEELMMGAFTFVPKTWKEEGNEFPEYWPQWLVFRFIGHVWGYYKDEFEKHSRSLKPLLEWATHANN